MLTVFVSPLFPHFSCPFVLPPPTLTLTVFCCFVPTRPPFIVSCSLSLMLSLYFPLVLIASFTSHFSIYAVLYAPLLCHFPSSALCVLHMCSRSLSCSLSLSLLLVFMSTPSLSSHFLPQIPAAEQPGSRTWACYVQCGQHPGPPCSS